MGILEQVGPELRGLPGPVCRIGSVFAGLSQSDGEVTNGDGTVSTHKELAAEMKELMWKEELPGRFLLDHKRLAAAITEATQFRVTHWQIGHHRRHHCSCQARGYDI